jgi:hypothetical protein
MFQGANWSEICIWLSTFRMYMIIRTFCTQQAEAIQIHENEQSEARHGNYKRLILGGGQACDRSFG